MMKLLYWTAEWHALGKLRMHTDTTLERLRHLTKEFGTVTAALTATPSSDLNTQVESSRDEQEVL